MEPSPQPDLRQGVKSLANTIRAVRRGGVHITLVKAEEGVGVFGLAGSKLPLGRGALRFLSPLLLRLVPRVKIEGLGEEDRFFLYFALQAMRHPDLLLYAPTIPTEVRANLPFVTFVDSVEEAIAAARRRFLGRAEVLTFPYGGITYPILPDGGDCGSARGMGWQRRMVLWQGKVTGAATEGRGRKGASLRCRLALFIA
jgi:hypothetical protein